MLILSLTSLYLACQFKPIPSGCDVSVARHHALAATLSLQTDEAIQLTVDIRQGSEEWSITEPTAAEVHTIPLLGLLPYEVVGYRLTGDDFECRGQLDAKSISGRIPEVRTETIDPDRMSNELFWLGSAISMDHGATPFAVDRAGRFRWIRPGQPERIGGQVEFRKGSRAVIFNSFATDFTLDSGVLRTVSLEGENLQQRPAPLSHHVFTQLPDGSVAYPAVELRDWLDPDTGEWVPVIGDTIVEMDTNGSERTVFSAWDWKPVQKHDHWTSSFYGDAHDWTHANALQYIEERDSYLITFPHLDTFLEIDRSTGEVTLEISPEGDVTVNGDFDHPHDTHWSDDGLLRLISHEEEGTVARAFSIDGTQLKLEWSYGSELNITGTVIGQHRRMNNGNIMVNFGGAGVMHEVTPEGDLVWSMSSELGYWLGNGQWFYDFYEGE